MTILAVDATQLCYRAKYTTGNLSHEDLGTGVVYGFLEQLLTLGKAFGPDTEFVFCWDSHKSLRRLVFPEYKAGRRRARQERTPLEVRADEICQEQFERLRTDVLPRCGFLNQIRQTGYEADDLMAALAARKPNVVMVTSDTDLYQMLSHAPMCRTDGVHYTANNLREDLGCTPEEFLEAKIIAGCDTDEVPGVTGVGIKTAIKWVQKKLKPSLKTYEAIDAFLYTGHQERNRKLIQLPFEGTRTPVTARCNFDMEGFRDVCQEHAFSSILRNLRPWRENFK